MSIVILGNWIRVMPQQSSISLPDIWNLQLYYKTSNNNGLLDLLD